MAVDERNENGFKLYEVEWHFGEFNMNFIYFSGTQPPAGTTNGSKFFKAKLPAGLTCSHCVMQWRWQTGL